MFLRVLLMPYVVLVCLFLLFSGRTVRVVIEWGAYRYTHLCMWETNVYGTIDTNERLCTVPYVVVTFRYQVMLSWSFRPFGMLSTLSHASLFVCVHFLFSKKGCGCGIYNFRRRTCKPNRFGGCGMDIIKIWCNPIFLGLHHKRGRDWKQIK